LALLGLLMGHWHDAGKLPVGVRGGTALCSVSSIDELNDDREGDGGRGRQRRM
jgi:hypothetical protein